MMPSFDIGSKVDSHELDNAINQVRKEIENRFDFKGVDARIEYSNNTITLSAPSPFQLTQLENILHDKMAKRGLSASALSSGEPEVALSETRKAIEVRQGIDKELAKKIVKAVKGAGLKVQTAIQGEEIRVTGKKRNDLQSVITLLREESFELPLQFENFRD